MPSPMINYDKIGKHTENNHIIIQNYATKMPPNNKENSIKLDYNNQDALPFNQPVYERKPGEIEPKVSIGSHPQHGGNPHAEEIDEEAGGLRITTRARHTYNLDRYSKNAMLIINNKIPMDEDNTPETLADTFAKYGFEVETLNQLSRDRIISSCDKFFARDFTEYGAVSIVILALSDGRGGFMADDAAYHADEVFKHISSELPPTLRGKPKICITETNTFDKHRDCTWPTSDDILECYIPVSFYSCSTLSAELSSCQPIHVLCRNIMQSGDKDDMFTIYTKTVHDINKYTDSTIFVNFPINITCTLTKELRLNKSE